VITSDHGENLWDHPVPFDHGLSVYGSTVNAVCLMRLPRGAGGGARLEGLTASIDVLPTMLTYLGLKLPKGIDGEAIDLTGPDVSTRTRFARASKPWKGVETDPRWRNELKAQCARDGRYKYIWTPYRKTEELYDLSADPGETTNLLPNASSDTRAVVARLRSALYRWRDSAAPLPSHFESSQQEETLERLRSLGYIQ